MKADPAGIVTIQVGQQRRLALLPPCWSTGIDALTVMVALGADRSAAGDCLHGEGAPRVVIHFGGAEA